MHRGVRMRLTMISKVVALGSLVVLLGGCGDEFQAGGGGSSATSSDATNGSTTATASSTDATGSTGSGPTCQSDGSACLDCTITACPAETCACLGNAACQELLGCYAGGSGEPWLQYCNTQTPSGISDAALLLNCVAQSCASASECASPGQFLSPCSECLFRNCPAEMNACLSIVDCADYVTCAKACNASDEACRNQCVQNYPDGADLAAPLSACATPVCAEACAGS